MIASLELDAVADLAWTCKTKEVRKYACSLSIERSFGMKDNDFENPDRPVLTQLIQTTEVLELYIPESTARTPTVRPRRFWMKNESSKTLERVGY